MAPGERNVASCHKSLAPEERSVASSRRSLTSRDVELAMEAAALKARVRHIDIESKMKAKLEKYRQTQLVAIAHLDWKRRKL